MRIIVTAALLIPIAVLRNLQMIVINEAAANAGSPSSGIGKQRTSQNIENNPVESSPAVLTHNQSKGEAAPAQSGPDSLSSASTANPSPKNGQSNNILVSSSNQVNKNLTQTNNTISILLNSEINFQSNPPSTAPPTSTTPSDGPKDPNTQTDAPAHPADKNDNQPTTQVTPVTSPVTQPTTPAADQKKQNPTENTQNPSATATNANTSSNPTNAATEQIPANPTPDQATNVNITIPPNITANVPDLTKSNVTTPEKTPDNATSQMVNTTTPNNDATNVTVPPVNNVTIPPVNVTIPSTNVTVPTINVTIPSANVTVPSINITVPSVNVTVPSVNVTVPTVPIANVTIPPSNVTVPSVNVTIPSVNVTIPKINVTIPPVNVTVPVVNVTVPSVNVTVPSVNITVPVSNITIPSTNQSQKPSENKPVIQVVVTPGNTTNTTQKKKDDKLPLGMRKFADSGLDEDLIPPGQENNTQFKKITSVPPSVLTPQLLDLKNFKRSFDGTNNNLLNKNWGAANTSQARHCKANYADKISVPVQGLPSPRLISDNVGAVREKAQLNERNVTMAFTIWGQFLDHDIEHSPSSDNDSFHIPIPKCDKFLDADCNGSRVIPFTRSIFINNPGVRTPINALTTWIDGSMIYGSSEAQAQSLRTRSEGRLKTDETTRMLPSGKRVDEKVSAFLKNSTDPNASKIVMEAGDSRSNENLILLSYQTLFLREHNRICDLFLSLLPANRPSDEQIYTIARNYVIGLIQKITFDDYLPIVLGDKAFQDLIGPYSKYNQSINPSIQIEFSAAGYRFGHSLLVSSIPLVNIYGDKFESLKLDEAFFRPELLNTVSMERILRGASRTVTKLRDGEFVDQVRNLLVLSPELRSVRMDLLSINIQRGRDQGIPGFNALRECYGLKRFTNFSQFSNESKKNGQLQESYQILDNVDSYVGIQVQKSVNGSILGETGIAIVASQFKKLRDGDRFWYEGIYPQAIVKEIKNTKLSHIIMRNTAILELQEDVFHYSFGG